MRCTNQKNSPRACFGEVTSTGASRFFSFWARRKQKNYYWPRLMWLYPKTSSWRGFGWCSALNQPPLRLDRRSVTHNRCGAVFEHQRYYSRCACSLCLHGLLGTRRGMLCLWYTIAAAAHQPCDVHRQALDLLAFPAGGQGHAHFTDFWRSCYCRANPGCPSGCSHVSLSLLLSSLSLNK